MKISGILISVLVVMMLLSGAVIYLSGLSGGYGTQADLSGYNKTIQRLNETQQKANATMSAVTSIKITGVTSLFWVPYEMMVGGWTVLLLVLSSFSTYTSLFSDVVSNLANSGIPIPGWVMAPIIVIVTVIIVFIIIEMFFRWKLEG